MSDNPNNICNNPTFLNMLDQKKRNALRNIPFPRYNNIDPSLNPYLQINKSTLVPFTKFDLDMRRKAEILTYSGNSSDRFTNKLTKKELWSQLVKGTYQQRTYSQAFIKANTLPNGTVQLCPEGTLIYTPTTASDVPGPVINLYNDPNVPIYNLVNDINNNAYSQINTNAVSRPAFDFTKDTDITGKRYSATNTTYTTFSSLYLYNPLNPITTFSIITPVSLQISNKMTVYPSSINSPDYPIYMDASAIFLSINKIYLNVLYSTSTVTLSAVPTISLVTIDSNASNSYTINYPMDIFMNIPTNNTLNSFFSATAYLGVLHIDGLKLSSLAGYIYDIQLVIDYNIVKSSKYNTYFPGNLETVNTTLNASNSINYGIGTNCSFNNITVDNPYPLLNIIAS